MRLAVVSDIHGNCVALDAVIADVARHAVDGWVCLGDALQGGPQPLEVVRRLQDLTCPVILGNADAFLLDPNVGEADATGEREQELRRIRAWTVGALGESGTAAVRTFVPTTEVDLGDAGTLLCFHGKPDDYNGVLWPETPTSELEAALAGRTASTFCGGHTHTQWIVRFGDRAYFNPGSVGSGYNRHLGGDPSFHFDPFAAYAILSTVGAEVRVEFKRIPFDVDALNAAALANGHPEGAALAARYRPPA